MAVQVRSLDGNTKL